MGWLRASLPARAGLAVLAIATLALISSLSAGLIAWLSQGDAAAINTAGSVRMQTYRLSWQLAAGAQQHELNVTIAGLQDRLEDPSLKALLENDPSDALRARHQHIRQQWDQVLRPALDRADAQFFQAQAPDFVEQLNGFVCLLQQQSEQKQRWQQLIQGLALFITLSILLVSLYELQSGVIIPLKELVDATQRFRRGDFQVRVGHQSEDELGQLATSFNAMAETIEQSHRTLETQVRQKTLHLRQTNAALELLYQSSASLATRQANAQELDQLIRRFQQRLPGLRLSLCLKGQRHAPALKAIALHGDNIQDLCPRSSTCALCHRHPEATAHTLSISHQGSTLGELKAHFVDGHPPEVWEKRLIQALAGLIGTSLSLTRQREQDHRLLLLEERAIIARELHDSLAQALTYMKLQVSRLQTLVRRGEPAQTLEAVTDEVRDGLNSAYRHLRELLTTFRLQIDEAGLAQELNDTAAEFSRRGEFQVHVQLDSLAFELSASEQIHLLQITREALSNCSRHAHARNAWLELRQEGEYLRLCITDDGRGLRQDIDPRTHHGLTIMAERARSLRGELQLNARAPHGTQVLVRLRPEFLQRHTEGNAS